MIGPVFEKYSNIYTDIEFRKVETDSQPEISQEMSIRSVRLSYPLAGRRGCLWCVFVATNVHRLQGRSEVAGASRRESCCS